MNREERWNVSLVQAQRFARRESYVDAVARARAVRDDVRAALATEVDLVARQKLEGLLRVAERALASYEAAFAEWNGKIAAARAERMANAAVEQSTPLPNPPDR
jgi:hypothetical protein